MGDVAPSHLSRVPASDNVRALTDYISSEQQLNRGPPME
jgi:hypothetical protein